MVKPKIVSGIEFWCVILKPGEKQCVRSAHKHDLIHITSACVSSANDAKGRTTIVCSASGSEGPICVLTSGAENQQLSLAMPGAENIYLEAKGADSVSISGFLQPLLDVETDAIARFNQWDDEIENTYVKILESQEKRLEELEAIMKPARRFSRGDFVEVKKHGGKWSPGTIVAVNLDSEDDNGELVVNPYLVKEEKGEKFLFVTDDDDQFIRKATPKKAKKQAATPKKAKKQAATAPGSSKNNSPHHSEKKRKKESCRIPRDTTGEIFKSKARNIKAEAS